MDQFSGPFEPIFDFEPAEYERADYIDSDYYEEFESAEEEEEEEQEQEEEHQYYIPVASRTPPSQRNTPALASIPEEDEDELQYVEDTREEPSSPRQPFASINRSPTVRDSRFQEQEEDQLSQLSDQLSRIGNQGATGQSNTFPPEFWPASNSSRTTPASKTTPAVKMAPSKVPKPGPAKLRPNSGPEEWLEEAKLCHYLPDYVMKQLCEIVKEHLMEESNIQPVSTPVVVCGDIHGQFYDLLELFRVAGGMPGETNVESPSTMITSDDLEPPDISGLSINDKKGEDDVDEEESRGRPRTAGQSSRGASSGADSGVKVNEVSGNGCQNFVFLGDFVDRGYFSLETLTLLLCLKALYPDKITLVRGNHESRQITQVYGFYEECMQKYGSASVWKACCQVFDFMILSAIIDGQILCVHGGLSPEIRTLDQIRVVARAQEIPHEGAFCDIVWSDPDEIDTWGVSPRGAGWLFGEKVASEFNHVNGLKLIARAHQLVNEGYKFHFPSKNVVTVWSAPNYCYRCGNVAAIMNVDANCNEKFSIFAAVPEDKRHVPSGRRPAGEYFL